MAAFTASQASVTNGSKVVTINSGESVANIRQGDFLFLAGFLVEINRGYVGAASQQYIELVKNWANSSQSSQPAVVIPTTGDFRAAVDAINNANKNVNDNFLAMQNWQTNMGTVTFTNQDGTTTTVKTLKQIEADNAAQMNAYHPYPWAMRKVEFEARRAANNEKFAASGFVHKGLHNIHASSGISEVNQGLFTRTQETTANSLFLGCSKAVSTAQGKSKESFAVTNIAGILTTMFAQTAISSDYGMQVKLPPAEDGTRTYDSATGVSITHATPAIAFASETATNKVVTDRVDMWGFEAFLREINDADPFVYKNGLIQSQASSINGVATVNDNVRPITYFAWYEGDTSSRGKGVNWQTATEAQRIAIASDPDNNIYFDDATGTFHQWCIRGRSFAGLGNGDWYNLDTATIKNRLGFNPTISTSSCVSIQGITNDDTGFTTTANYAETYLTSSSSSAVTSYASDMGIFKIRDHYTATAKTLDQECCFLVCGTVNRLNKGAYHPSFNPHGAAKIAVAGVGHLYWQHPGNDKLNSVVDCFKPYDSSSWGYFGGSISVGVSTGSTGQGVGRPDARFYDAIYENGYGGVCRDMRYSAWGLTQKDFSDADLAIKSGEYRGVEKLVKTLIFTHSINGGIISSAMPGYRSDVHVILNNVSNPKAYDYYVFNVQTKEIEHIKNIPENVRLNLYYPEEWGENVEVIIVYPDEINVSIAGECTYMDVVGDPENILLCNVLKNGWVGGWVSTVPDSVIKFNELVATRPTNNSTIDRYTTDNNGDTWSTVLGSGFSAAPNTPESNSIVPTGRVEIWFYKTKAKMTNIAPVATVYGGISTGLHDLFASSRAQDATGRMLGFSLTGGINKSVNVSSLSLDNGFYKLKKTQMANNLSTLMDINNAVSTHDPIDLISPTNNSPAFKALAYNVAQNHQGFINYAYAELVYNGTDWGDDSKVHIVDNQTTMLDENGNTVLVGTARCVEPLGWIKNDK